MYGVCDSFIFRKEDNTARVLEEKENFMLEIKGSWRLKSKRYWLKLLKQLNLMVDNLPKSVQSKLYSAGARVIASRSS